MALNVQFSDATGSTVVAYFASPQDAGDYQNLGLIDQSDARWATFYEKVSEIGISLPPPIA